MDKAISTTKLEHQRARWGILVIYWGFRTTDVDRSGERMSPWSWKNKPNQVLGKKMRIYHTHTKSSSRSCEDIDVIHFPKLWRYKALVPHPSTKHAVWSSYRSFQVQDMTKFSWSNHPGKDVAETGRIPSPQQLCYMHSNKISGTRCTSQEPVFDMTGWRPQSLRWECSDVGLGPCGRWHFSSENMHR